MSDAASTSQGEPIHHDRIDHSASRSSRAFGVALTAGIVALALTTAYIHLGLGGLLFTLNGIGYIGLAVLYVIGAVAPIR